MAQHLPIQAKHHCQLKQHTRKQRKTAFLPGSAHTQPGETVPDRLAVFTHRQAPGSSQTHCFLVTAWRSSTLPVRRLSVQDSLTLRLSPDGDQQAVRRHIRGILQLIFGTQF